VPCGAAHWPATVGYLPQNVVMYEREQRNFRVIGHRSRRCLLVVVLFLVQLAVGITKPVAADDAVPPGASQYVAITPFRLADTRPSEGAFGYTTVNAKTIRVNITGRNGVPANATAAVVNLTLIDSAGPGFITAYPSGTALPTASNLNSDAAGRTIANLAHVKIGADGSIELMRTVTAHLAVDLVGVYVPVTEAVGGGRLVTRASGALRVLDTRDLDKPVAAGSVTTVDLTKSGIPLDAMAAVINLTAVAAPRGFWTTFTSGTQRPGTSSLNIDAPGQTRPGQAIVPLNGTSRTLEVFSKSGGHLLVDVVGWFTGAGVAPATEGLFIPSAPRRALDSRNSRQLALWGGSTVEFATGNGALQVSAVVLNVTGTSPWSNGFVTAYPAGVARPVSSNLNISSWPQTVANHAIVRVSTRGVALFTNAGAHLIADVAGWYLGAPSVPTLAVPVNPNYSPNRAVGVQVNKIGLAAFVNVGTNLDTVADRGVAAAWADSANVASAGNVMLFGHRTTHGAIFRYINSLKPGDTFSLWGADGHSYNYLVMFIGVTTPSFPAIFGMAASSGAPVTAQLVACSKSDGSPTSLLYRVVVTGRLVSVT
jgi:sortase (surface protein transpeptidase)